MGVFLTVFISIFLAELGDKTQLATVLFAADGERSRAVVFLAAAAALIASTGFAVLLGAAAERFLPLLPLKAVAGIGFIIIGGVLLAEHFFGATGGRA